MGALVRALPALYLLLFISLTIHTMSFCPYERNSAETSLMHVEHHLTYFIYAFLCSEVRESGVFNVSLPER